MAYQIFRVAKVKRQGVGGCQQEHNRTEKDAGRFPDSEIDYTRTKDNIYLMESKDYWGDIKKTLKRYGIEKWRKDAVVMNDAIYTASPEAMANMSRDEMLQYFMDCAEWHQEHFGPVINAVIHYDETTPHLHIDSIPLVQKEDGTWKLSAKDQYGNRAKLASLQTDLNEKVSKYYGLERGETRNPNEQRKHKTKLDHEIETLETKKNTEIEYYNNVGAIGKKIEKHVKQLKDSQDMMQMAYKSIQAQVDSLQRHAHELTEEELKERLKEIDASAQRFRESYDIDFEM